MTPSVRAACAVVDPPRKSYVEDPSIPSFRDLVEPFGSTADEELLRAGPNVFHRDLVNAGPLRADAISAVKTLTAELADESTLLAAELLGAGSLFTDPWLHKAHRDGRAFKFMEGTGQIRRLAVFQGVLKERSSGGGFPC
jgi:alkylation response protein AidB-like acyl-CoA dehydrogenase